MATIAESAPAAASPSAAGGDAHCSPPRSSSLSSCSPERSPSAYSPDDSSAASSMIVVHSHVRQQRQRRAWRHRLQAHKPMPALGLALVALMALLLFAASMVLPSQAVPLEGSSSSSSGSQPARGGMGLLASAGRRAGGALAASAARRQQLEMEEEEAEEDLMDGRFDLFDEQTLFGPPRHVRPHERIDRVQQLTGVVPLFGKSEDS